MGSFDDEVNSNHGEIQYRPTPDQMQIAALRLAAAGENRALKVDKTIADALSDRGFAGDVASIVGGFLLKGLQGEKVCNSWLAHGIDFLSKVYPYVLYPASEASLNTLAWAAAVPKYLPVNNALALGIGSLGFAIQARCKVGFPGILFRNTTTTYLMRMAFEVDADIVRAFWDFKKRKGDESGDEFIYVPTRVLLEAATPEGYETIKDKFKLDCDQQTFLTIVAHAMNQDGLGPNIAKALKAFGIEQKEEVVAPPSASCLGSCFPYLDAATMMALRFFDYQFILESAKKGFALTLSSDGSIPERYKTPVDAMFLVVQFVTTVFSWLLEILKPRFPLMIAKMPKLPNNWFTRNAVPLTPSISYTVLLFSLMPLVAQGLFGLLKEGDVFEQQKSAILAVLGVLSLLVLFSLNKFDFGSLSGDLVKTRAHHSHDDYVQVRDDNVDVTALRSPAHYFAIRAAFYSTSIAVSLAAVVIRGGSTAEGAAATTQLPALLKDVLFVYTLVISPVGYFASSAVESVRSLFFNDFPVDMRQDEIRRLSCCGLNALLIPDLPSLLVAVRNLANPNDVSSAGVELSSAHEPVLQSAVGKGRGAESAQLFSMHTAVVEREHHAATLTAIALFYQKGSEGSPTVGEILEANEV